MSYNELTQYNSPNYTPAASVPGAYGMSRTVEGITIHWWGDPSKNPSFLGIVNYLCRQGGNTSAHAVVTGSGRQVAWIINDSDAAWHSGNAYGNAKTIGIECDPRCRDEDYDVLGELIADIWRAHGRKIPLYPHNHWSPTSCPGNYDLNRVRLIAEAKFNGTEEEVKIGSGDNWRNRMNKLHHQLVRNGDMSEDVFKSIQGRDAWSIIESWSDHPEAGTLIAYQEIGQKAETEGWRKRLEDNQKTLTELNAKLAELSALPGINANLKKEVDELRAKNALLISSNSELEQKAKADAEAGQAFFRRVGQWLSTFLKK